MFTDTPPVATGFAVFCVFLFFVLIIAWCCKKLAHSKAPEISLVPSQGRYISTIDVQTGLPVVIDLSTLTGSRGSQTRVVSIPQRTPSVTRPINTRGCYTLYGSIDQHPPCQACLGDVLPRTPPPPYSEVVPQSRSA